MSQYQYDDLIERIYQHCQRVALAALRRRPDAGGYRHDYDGYSNHELKSYITLKKNARQASQFAFPVVTEEQIQAAESLLGFPLPPLLRSLYLRIANGGFGPGYGIIGLPGGYSLDDGFGKDIVDEYMKTLQNNMLIRLNDYELVSQAQRYEALKRLPPEDVVDWTGKPLPLHDPEYTMDSNWNQMYLYEFPHDVWPEYLVPICYWGCGICSYIDAKTDHIFQVAASDRRWHYIMVYSSASLQQWLEQWLAGKDLQLL